MPTKQLPTRPNLEQLKRQAQDLIEEHAAGDPRACQRLREFHPRFVHAADQFIRDARLSWSDALFAIAREYGYASWARLKARVAVPGAEADLRHHERIADPLFRHAVDLIDDGDVESLARLLDRHPDLVERHVTFEGGNYFRNPGLLAFVAENPVRHECMPPRIVEVARLLLERGAGGNRRDVEEALTLVASGRVAREAGFQRELIDLLCRYRADRKSALDAALAHGEFEAATALLAHGAAVTLPVAAALGDAAQATKSLATASPAERHLALAYAAQHGRTPIVRLLLDAGEDPNRYNPVGAHAHSTPLHQAAQNGHVEVVRVLIEHGARADLKDTLWNGTALDWARHAGRDSVIRELVKGKHD